MATLTPTVWWDPPQAPPAVASSGRPIADLRKIFADERARNLVSRSGGPTEPFVPGDGHALSQRMVFFADDDILSVVVGPQENQRDVDRALAYGLAHAGDRDLHLVLPADKAYPTLARSPWIEVPLRAWAYNDRACVEQVFPAPDEVLATYTDLLETHRHVLQERAAWVERLIDWADADSDLQPTHRKSYLAWQCRGMRVLKIARTRKGLRITAGIDYSTPKSEQQPALVEDLDGETSAALVHRVISKAATAMADRLDRSSVGYQEHLLQGLLIGRPRDLGLVAMQREFPAYRPPRQRAYIDFLGIDADARIHVVETKIGNDEMLVLQGLDYWIWATAHAESLATHFGVDTTPAVTVDYVVTAPKGGSAIGPYSAAQAEALVGSIPWRFHEVTDWHGADPVVTPLARRQAPNAPRYTSPRYAIALGEHLVHCAGAPLKRHVFYNDPQDGLVPVAHAVYDHLKERKLLHPYIGHVRSSQAFALNLFAPLSGEGVGGLLRSLGLDIQHAHAPTFEYSDPEDRLGEHTSDRPHATQVDVVLRGFDAAGSTCLALVEVKLSEIDLGPCSAYLTDQNPDRHICRHDGPFGDSPELCFQLSNWGGSTRRRYDTYIGSVSATEAHPPGCLFRLGMNQPMRNVALARALVKSGAADRVIYALCAPQNNSPIWRRWSEAEHLFSDVPGVTLARLMPSQVLEHHNDGSAETLVNRYELAPGS